MSTDRLVDLRDDVAAAAEFILTRWPVRPSFGIILGTGTGRLAEQFTEPCTVAYGDVPAFARSTAPGHRGQLVCGRLGGQPIIAMQGRFHRYEGYSAAQVSLPIRVLHQLGVNTLLISNAAGGLNPLYRSGDLMLIESHVDLMNRSAAGGYPAMWARTGLRSDHYDRSLMDEAVRCARQANFVLHRGVYAAMSGPTYETRAEYRFLRRAGADVVGMSTVPEVVVAAQLGLRVLACSLVANVAQPDAPQPTSGQAVIEAAELAAQRWSLLVKHALGAH